MLAASDTNGIMASLVKSKAWLGVLAVAIFYMIMWLYRVRNVLSKTGIPSQSLPHNIFLGHALFLQSETKKFPPDLHPAFTFTSFVKKYNLWSENLVYLDLAPFLSDNIVFPINGEAVQAIHRQPFLKSPFVTSFVGDVIGKRGLALLEGQEWKEMRTIFNPYFSSSNIMSLVPCMVEEGEVFVSIISEAAKKDGFIPSMELLSKHMTFDIIMQAILGIKSQSQRSSHPLDEALQKLSVLPGDATSLNPLQRLNFVRFGKMKYYKWKVEQWARPVLLKRWEKVTLSRASDVKDMGDEYELRVGIDLPLEKYRDERIAASKPLDAPSNDHLDLWADQIKSFIFGGHDTTASTTAWCIYELSRNPNVMAKLRREHDSVFGPDINTTGQRIKLDPHLLNKLPYTIAVIKETLRIFPVASSLQAALPNVPVTATINGTPYPLTNQTCAIMHQVLGRNPTNYPNPNEFLPERFIPSPSTPAINPECYRPFERGSRNCIGQELAMVKLKIVLLLTVRKFDFKEGYDEMYRREGRKGPVLEVEEFGGKAYMVSSAGNKPKDGIPMWVNEVAS